MSDQSVAVLFLDIDGVLVTLHTLETRAARGRAGKTVVNQLSVDALNRITIATGAKIVISSAWRFSGLLEMRAVLTLWGVLGEVIDIMPDLCTKRPGGLWEGAERWTEIQAWLDKMPVCRYVILDDIKTMGPMDDRHICTEETVGLTHEDANRAIRILESGI